MNSPAYMVVFKSNVLTCALKLDTQTSGWHKTLISVLKSVDGVSYSIDAEQGIAYISGKIDAGKLLKMLAKSQTYAKVCWINSLNHNASNSRMPFHGCNTYNNTGYGKYYHPDGRREYLNHWPHSHYDQPYPSQIISFYEPLTAMYFPQAPPQKEDFNVGDAQWCSIM